MADSAPVAGGSLPLSPAVVGGRRRSHKKLRMVKKKTVRKMLKKLGLKMRGGAPAVAEVKPDTLAADTAATGVVTGGAADVAAVAGRRRRHTKKTHRRSRRRSLFGMKY
jgi:hypothetical protein